MDDSLLDAAILASLNDSASTPLKAELPREESVFPHLATGSSVFSALEALDGFPLVPRFPPPLSADLWYAFSTTLHNEGLARLHCDASPADAERLREMMARNKALARQKVVGERVASASLSAALLHSSNGGSGGAVGAAAAASSDGARAGAAAAAAAGGTSLPDLAAVICSRCAHRCGPADERLSLLGPTRSTIPPHATRLLLSLSFAHSDETSRSMDAMLEATVVAVAERAPHHLPRLLELVVLAACRVAALPMATAHVLDADGGDAEGGQESPLSSWKGLFRSHFASLQSAAPTAAFAAAATAAAGAAAAVPECAKRLGFGDDATGIETAALEGAGRGKDDGVAPRCALVEVSSLEADDLAFRGACGEAAEGGTGSPIVATSPSGLESQSLDSILRTSAPRFAQLLLWERGGGTDAPTSPAHPSIPPLFAAGAPSRSEMGLEWERGKALLAAYGNHPLGVLLSTLAGVWEALHAPRSTPPALLLSSADGCACDCHADIDVEDGGGDEGAFPATPGNGARSDDGDTLSTAGEDGGPDDDVGAARRHVPAAAAADASFPSFVGPRPPAAARRLVAGKGGSIVSASSAPTTLLAPAVTASLSAGNRRYGGSGSVAGSHVSSASQQLQPGKGILRRDGSASSVGGGSGIGSGENSSGGSTIDVLRVSGQFVSAPEALRLLALPALPPKAAAAGGASASPPRPHIPSRLGRTAAAPSTPHSGNSGGARYALSPTVSTSAAAAANGSLTPQAVPSSRALQQQRRVGRYGGGHAGSAPRPIAPALVASASAPPSAAFSNGALSSAAASATHVLSLKGGGAVAAVSMPPHLVMPMALEPKAAAMSAPLAAPPATVVDAACINAAVGDIKLLATHVAKCFLARRPFLRRLRVAYRADAAGGGGSASGGGGSSKAVQGGLPAAPSSSFATRVLSPATELNFEAHGLQILPQARKGGGGEERGVDKGRAVSSAPPSSSSAMTEHLVVDCGKCVLSAASEALHTHVYGAMMSLIRASTAADDARWGELVMRPATALSPCRFGMGHRFCPLSPHSEAGCIWREEPSVDHGALRPALIGAGEESGFGGAACAATRLAALIYAPAIAILRLLPRQRSPLTKIATLQATLASIGTCMRLENSLLVGAQRRSGAAARASASTTADVPSSSPRSAAAPEPPPEALTVGADDLMPRLCFALAQAALEAPFSEVAYVDACLPPDKQLGEHGYACISFSGAVTFVAGLCAPTTKV